MPKVLSLLINQFPKILNTTQQLKQLSQVYPTYFNDLFPPKSKVFICLKDSRGSEPWVNPLRKLTIFSNESATLKQH